MVVVTIATLLAILLLRDVVPLKEVLMGLVYMGYIYLIVFVLLKAPTTRFQRVLAIIYGVVPLLSVVLYHSLRTEVSEAVGTTSSGGFAYYSIILFMQLVGSVGYLLMVLENSHSELEELAGRDYLTGALNRRSFFKEVRARAASLAGPISFIMIDIDDFKSINDRFGHEVGDQVLVHLTKTIQSTVRESDLLARFGGEEFLLLLPATGRSIADDVMGRVFRNIRHKREGDTTLPRYTISAGVVSVAAVDLLELQQYISRSDEGLYISKRTGKNRVTHVHYTVEKTGEK